MNTTRMRNPLPMTKRRAAWLPAFLVLLALAAAACSSSKTGTAASSSPASSASTPPGLAIDYGSLSGTLNGSGSSFQDAFNQKTITQFKVKAPNVNVSYTKSGSGAGKQDIENKIVQFAGSDSVISDADKAKLQGGEVLYFPTVASPITVAYNVNGLTSLKLTGETLGGIFAGKITNWNDPKILADNPTAPNLPIVVVHRSDASGTTSNFTKYLTKAGGPDWTLGSSDTVNWAVGQGAEKNSGVASLISTTNGAIGYVDLADAANANLSTASVKNSAGTFVDAKIPGATAALAGTTVNPDLTYDPINASGADAYPITSPTWIIVYKHQPDAVTANALKGFLNFALTDGQGFANSVGFASLPADLQAKAIAQLGQITTG